MSAGNHVTLTGNVTRDPELRFTNGGAALVNFGLAVNRRWQDRDGEWQEEAHFFDVTAWQDLAENVAQTITKGARVIVDGRLRFHTWETDDGENRSKVEIVADDVGPSLRWATAEVTRNEREGGGSNERSSSSGRRGDSEGSGSRRGSRDGGRRGSRDRASTRTEEEPF